MRYALKERLVDILKDWLAEPEWSAGTIIPLAFAAPAVSNMTDRQNFTTSSMTDWFPNLKENISAPKDYRVAQASNRNTQFLSQPQLLRGTIIFAQLPNYLDIATLILTCRASLQFSSYANTIFITPPRFVVLARLYALYTGSCDTRRLY